MPSREFHAVTGDSPRWHRGGGNSRFQRPLARRPRLIQWSAHTPGAEALMRASSARAAMSSDTSE